MKQVISRVVLSWGDALIHDRLTTTVREKIHGPRSKGDEYSSEYGYGVYDVKKTQIPESMGNASRDIGGSPGVGGTPPEPSSGYQKDVEFYGDGRATDDDNRRMPNTDHHTQLLRFNDLSTINNLFNTESLNRDKGTSQSVRKHLQSVYNKEPVRRKRV